MKTTPNETADGTLYPSKAAAREHYREAGFSEVPKLRRDEAFVHVPTVRERFWRWAGFRYHCGEEPEGTEGMAGWSRTDIRIHFGWADRIRLLFTGRLFIASILHTDTPSANVCKSRIDWMIKSPGDATR